MPYSAIPTFRNPLLKILDLPLQTPTILIISHLSANMEASFLYTVVAGGPIPPQAEKTRGEKQTLSTSLTLSS